MAVGAVELLLLAIVGTSILFAIIVTKKRWMLGLLGYFVIAALFTPADPLSLLLIAVPSCCIYTIALLMKGRLHRQVHDG